MILKDYKPPFKGGNDVSTLSIGDLNNDGESKIIIGAEIQQNNTTIYVIDSDFNTIASEVVQAGITTTSCFDIDNDGKDEILLGGNNGILYIYKLENKSLKFITSQDLKGASNNVIRGIKALNIKEYKRNLIVVGSTGGNFRIYHFNEKNELDVVFREEPFNIYSILLLKINNCQKIVLGGEGKIALYDFSSLSNNSSSASLLLDEYEDSSKNKNEIKKQRIYDIAFLKEYDSYSRIICATRSGKPMFFDVSVDGISFTEKFHAVDTWKGSSSYSIMLFDIDNDGNNEIIIAGKGESGGGIDIYKFDDTKYWSYCERSVYKEEIYSLLPCVKNGAKLIILSMFRHPLVVLRPEYFEPLKDQIKQIGKDIFDRPGEYVFFTGAGFSWPIFGLADNIKNGIMKKYKLIDANLLDFFSKYTKDKELSDTIDLEEIIERRPLELLLSYIKHQINPDAMKDVVLNFFSNTDETTHKSSEILAELIENKWITTVFTVNYDTLIESRFNRQDELKKIIKDGDYKSTNICGHKSIIKLHGCITNPDSIAGALDEVYKLSPKREKAIDFIFNGHKIIFVGYSCRDADIFPILDKAIKEYSTTCYFVDPFELNKNAKKLIDSSGMDPSSRHIQIKSEEFFEILNEGIKMKTEGI